MRVGVVGGGITGLALQHYLHERGVESRVYEAASEPGGVIRSRRVEGRVVELGPQRTRYTPLVESLVADLGIGDRRVEAPDLPLYVYRAGDLHRAPLSLRAALATGLLSWRSKLRVLLEPLAGPPRDGETVLGYLERAFGREAARYLFAPLYAGLYASDPAEMPVRYSLGRALDHAGVDRSVLITVARKLLRGVDLPPAVSFDDGLATLPRTLAERHAEAVHLDTPVRDLHLAGDRITLVTADGTDAVDAAVLATPADATAGILRSAAPETADALDRLAYNPLAVVALRSDADLDAKGYQVPGHERLRTLGVTANAALFDRDGVYTAFFGGARDPELLERSDAAIGRLAAGEFEAATGAAAEWFHVARLPRAMPAYDQTWSALAAVDPPPGVSLCANYESRPGIPGRLRNARRLAEHLAERDGGGVGQRKPNETDPQPARPS